MLANLRRSCIVRITIPNFARRAYSRSWPDALSAKNVCSYSKPLLLSTVQPVLTESIVVLLFVICVSSRRQRQYFRCYVSNQTPHWQTASLHSSSWWESSQARPNTSESNQSPFEFLPGSMTSRLQASCSHPWHK